MAPYISTIQATLALVVAIWLWRRIAVWIGRRKAKRASGCLPVPKIPDWDPVLGMRFTYEFVTTDMLRHQLIANFYRRFDQYGNTFSANLAGHQLLATCDHENIRAILTTQFENFSNRIRQKPAQSFMGQGIFLSDGDAWRRSRALVRPNFARDQIADLESLERHLQRLFSLLPQDGSVVDLMPLFFSFTMDTSTEFLFGESVKILEAHARPGWSAPTGDRSHGQGSHYEVEGFASAWEYAEQNMLLRFVLGPAMHIYRDTKAERSIAMVHAHVDRYVDAAIRYNEQVSACGNTEKAEQTPAGRYVFLHALAGETKDRRMLRNDLMNILMAGRDTTASLLSNLFHTLARRPDIWIKLQKEAESLNGKPPTYEALRDMTYLKWCINESLRVHSVVGILGKEAEADTVLPRGGGPDGRAPIFVTKGSLVLYSMLAMHRRKDLFGEDAHEFRPERWGSIRPGWTYVPFNGGPRICVGQQYALTEVSYVVVRFVQMFAKMTNGDQLPWAIGPKMTVCPLHGTKVALSSNCKTTPDHI